MFDDFLRQCVEIIVDDPHADFADADALLHSLAHTGRILPREERVSRLLKELDGMSRGATDFVRGVQVVLSCLRQRLPGALMTVDLSRGFLKCRAIR